VSLLDTIHVDQPDDLLIGVDNNQSVVHLIQNASSTPSDTATPVASDGIKPADAVLAGTFPNLKSLVFNANSTPSVIQRIGPGGIEATFHDDADFGPSSSARLAYDNVHDALYVATTGPVFCYLGLLGAASGNVTPTATVTCANGAVASLEVDFVAG